MGSILELPYRHSWFKLLMPSFCSVFAKLFDLIFIDKFRDCLCTSELQFGFKKKHLTSTCTMVLKETLSYYSVDGGNTFCTLLDATKAFDSIDYCKLFRELTKRDVPAIYLRLLLNMYISSVARICWNGVFSQFVSRMELNRAVLLVPFYFVCILTVCYRDYVIQKLAVGLITNLIYRIYSPISRSRV